MRISREDALSALYQHGAHFVLARLVQTEAGAKKPPLWSEWQKTRPTLDLVQHHHRRGGDALLGLIPGSIDNTGLDVDSGDAAALVAATGPHTSYPTRRGSHHWYADAETRRAVKWQMFGCTGQVVSDSGYLVLWGDAAQRLVTGLVLRPPDSALFPADLFEWADIPPPPLATAPIPDLGPHDEPIQLPMPGVEDWHGGPHLDNLEGIYPGRRTFALFYVVRHWAYRQNFKRYGLEKWLAHVQGFTRRENGRFPLPMDEAAADTLAYSVATWTWAKMGFGRDSESQAARGVKSGATRRARVAIRDERIAALRQAGHSQRAILSLMDAEGTPVSKGGLGYILRRDGVSPDATVIRGRPAGGKKSRTSELPGEP